MQHCTRTDSFEEEEKVTIPKLMKKTGLPRGFFYKNPVAQKEMDRALDLQAGMAPAFWGVRGFGERVHITKGMNKISEKPQK